MEKLCHESGVWMVTVLLGDESGARLKVHLSNEVRNCCVVYRELVLGAMGGTNMSVWLLWQLHPLIIMCTQYTIDYLTRFCRKQ